MVYHVPAVQLQLDDPDSQQAVPRVLSIVGFRVLIVQLASSDVRYRHLASS